MHSIMIQFLQDRRRPFGSSVTGATPTGRYLADVCDALQAALWGAVPPRSFPPDENLMEQHYSLLCEQWAEAEKAIAEVASYFSMADRFDPAAVPASKTGDELDSPRLQFCIRFGQ